MRAFGLAWEDCEELLRQLGCLARVDLATSWRPGCGGRIAGMSTPVARTLPPEIESRRADVARICARLGVRRLELFGSGTRSASPRDLDFLADLGDRPPAEYAAAYFALREELERLFAMPVDIVTPPGLGNPYFRQRVEQEKTLLYAA